MIYCLYISYIGIKKGYLSTRLLFFLLKIYSNSHINPDDINSMYTAD